MYGRWGVFVIGLVVVGPDVDVVDVAGLLMIDGTRIDSSRNNAR